MHMSRRQALKLGMLAVPVSVIFFLLISVFKIFRRSTVAFRLRRVLAFSGHPETIMVDIEAIRTRPGPIDSPPRYAICRHLHILQIGDSVETYRKVRVHPHEFACFINSSNNVLLSSDFFGWCKIEMKTGGISLSKTFHGKYHLPSMCDENVKEGEIAFNGRSFKLRIIHSKDSVDVLLNNQTVLTLPLSIREYSESDEHSLNHEPWVVVEVS